MNTQRIIAYTGKIGSGKFFCMSREIEKLKTTGHTIYLTSFADPIKQILKNCFGFTKEGKIVDVKLTPFFVKYKIIDSIFDLIRKNKSKKFKDISDIKLKVIISDNYDKHSEKFIQAINACRMFNDKDSEYKHGFRTLAQLLGTELARQIDNSIWIDTVFTKIKQVFTAGLADYAFIDDLRFLNEAEEFKNCGYEYKIFGVVASDELRAQRRGITIEKLIEENNHASEKEIGIIIDNLPEKCIIINE